MLSRLGKLGLFLTLISGLLFSAPGASAGRDIPGPATRAVDGVRATQARAALSSARAVLTDAKGKDATLALRDLALLKADLPEAERGEAARILARPTEGGSDQQGDGYSAPEATPVCSSVVCVHYVVRSADRPDLTDSDTNGVPDYVDLAVSTLTHVHKTYVDAGYRSPKGDGILGGNAKVDVYLKDIDAGGLYGYCTSDQAVLGAHRDAWAYCVLDDDYANFASNTPRENLQVTAAHEYFHAVQFAYDIGEDGWFMEATATWAEDELYDRVNDNRQYLDYSPITRPAASMDQFDGRGFHYGTWIFFRWLSERFPGSTGAMPTIVRDMWRRADDARGGLGEYSLQAVSKVLSKQKLPLTEAFARFSQANRSPGRSYGEGRTQRYPASPLARLVRLSTSRSTSDASLSLDHLASGTVRFVPGSGVTTGNWKLRLKLDLSDQARGAAAVLTLQKQDEAPEIRLVRLSSKGTANVATKFGSNQVAWVELTLVNAGDAFRCARGTRFSCSGKPEDDNLVQRFTARVVPG